MIIEVYNNDINELIYNGCADEFLFENDNDLDIELALNKLEYGLNEVFLNEYLIIKINEYIY